MLARAPRPLWWGALACALAACDVAADRPAAWSYVYPAVLQPACATAACHSAVAARAGIDLSTSAAAYAVLTGQVCGAPPLPGAPAGNFVRPGSPEGSQLMYLLRGAGVPVMPPDVPLPDVELELVERWILDGARCE